MPLFDLQEKELTIIRRLPAKVTSLTCVVIVGVSFLTVPACTDTGPTPVAQVENGLLPLVASKEHLGVKSNIEQRMLHYGVPGVSVAVFENGKIEWAKGYGTARPNENVPVTETTLFQGASISKSVTAVGALRLVQDGELGVEQNVNSTLTSWHLPSSPFTEDRNVTLRGLLNHSAGITVHGFPGYARDATVPTLIEVLNGEGPANTERIEVDIPIGETWRYSGGGYTIIQQLLMDVSQQSFQQFMTENVLSPLGMASSTFELVLDETQEAKTAWGYRPGLGPVVSGYHIYPESAAAGLWTTPTDIALFALGVHESAVGSPTSLIDEPLAKEMLTAQKGNYGFGVMVSGEGASHRFRHTGINQGFDSMYVAYSELGTGAVVMTNSNLSSGLIKEIIGSVAREYSWPDYPAREQRETSPFSEQQLKSLPGTYKIEEGFDVSVVSDGDRLFMSFPDQGRTEIHSDPSNGTLFVTGFPFPPFRLVVVTTGRQIQFPPFLE